MADNQIDAVDLFNLLRGCLGVASGNNYFSVRIIAYCFADDLARLHGRFTGYGAGVDYNDIKPQDIVIVDFEGNIVDGDKKPSIEVPLHTAIYRERQDVNAIVHTHSTYVTAMAIARKPIPAACEDMVQIVGGDVRVSEYVLPGSNELGVKAVEAMEGRMAVILANHGCLGAGRDLKEALKTVQVVEKSAQATILANMMGGVVELDQQDVDIMRDFYLNKYGQR